MNIERTRYLYTQYHAGLLTEAERLEWELILESDEVNVALKEIVGEEWDALSPDVFAEMNTERSLEILKQIVDQPQERKVRRLWPRIAVAAAAVAAITLGTWLYVNEIASSRNASRNDEVVSSMNDIKPGSVGATLTLANGKTIKLSSATNGELAKEAGVIITKSADGQLIYEIASSQNVPRNDGAELKTNTLSTAKGETYQVKLPDGTAVWLNAASRLTYSATLNQQRQRRVVLEGEAYFQVAKDRAHPFIVESKGQQVEVLGTHFNINAYANEKAVKTTLLEGIVRVNGTTLKPNQQSVLTPDKRMQVEEVNPSESIDWKNEGFAFNGVDFASAMRKIERWYNVDIVFDPAIVNKVEIGGFISRKNNLSAVLKLIESTGQIHFKIKERRIIVTQ